MAGRHRAVECGDAGAMGVAVGVAQLGRYAGFEALGDEVLQALGFVVKLVDFVVEHAVQEGLDEAMVADDLQGAATTCVGETDTVVPLVFNQRVLGGGELLQHVGDRGGSYLQTIGQRGRADAAALGSSQGEDGFEVIVDRLAALVNAGARTVRHGARLAPGCGSGCAESAGHGRRGCPSCSIFAGTRGTAYAPGAAGVRDNSAFCPVWALLEERGDRVERVAGKPFYV